VTLAVIGLLSLFVVYRLAHLMLWAAKFAPLEYLTHWRFDLLLAACALAFAKLQGIQLPHIPKPVAVATFIECVAVASLCGDALGDGWLVQFVERSILLIGLPLVVEAAAQGAWPNFRPDGEVSRSQHAAYLFHFPVMALLWAPMWKFTPNVFFVNSIWFSCLQAAVCLPLILIIPNSVFRCIEQPFMQKGRFRSTKFAYRDNGRARLRPLQ
jgi:hypothetical protein